MISVSKSFATAFVLFVNNHAYCFHKLAKNMCFIEHVNQCPQESISRDLILRYSCKTMETVAGKWYEETNGN